MLKHIRAIHRRRACFSLNLTVMQVFIRMAAGGAVPVIEGCERNASVVLHYVSAARRLCADLVQFNRLTAVSIVSITVQFNEVGQQQLFKNKLIKRHP